MSIVSNVVTDGSTYWFYNSLTLLPRTKKCGNMVLNSLVPCTLSATRFAVLKKFFSANPNLLVSIVQTLIIVYPTLVFSKKSSLIAIQHIFNNVSYHFSLAQRPDFQTLPHI